MLALKIAIGAVATFGMLWELFMASGEYEMKHKQHRWRNALVMMLLLLTVISSGCDKGPAETVVSTDDSVAVYSSKAEGTPEWILAQPFPETIEDAQKLLTAIDDLLLQRDSGLHCCFGPRWMWENANDSTRTALRSMRRQLSSKFIFLKNDDGTSVITGLR